MSGSVLINSAALRLDTSKIDISGKVIISLIFFISFSPFLSRDVRPITQLISFGILAVAYIYRFGMNIPLKIITVMVIVFILVFFQSIFFGKISLIHLIRYPVIVVLVPYFIYRIYGISALSVVADFIWVTAIISMIFWSLQHIVSGFADDLYTIAIYLYKIFPYDSWPRSLIIYTCDPKLFFMDNLGVYRNAGIFHEPGALAFWINFALIIQILKGKGLFNPKNIFLIIVILTTFSTAGYIQFFVVGVSYFLATQQYNVVVKYSVLIVFVITSLFAWESFDFLGNKVNTHRETQMNEVLAGSQTTGRFMRIRKGWSALIESPVIGRGIASSSQDDDSYSSVYIGNVGGFIGFFARYGILIGLLFFAFMLKGFYLVGRIHYKNLFLVIGLFSTLLIGTIGQGTTIWNPFIQLFFFHGYLKIKQYVY